MKTQQRSPASNLYTINWTERDRIMAAAYLARAECFAELFLKAGGALARQATALKDALRQGAASTKQWFAH